MADWIEVPNGSSGTRNLFTSCDSKNALPNRASGEE
jgi:hypothetical protein